jgi:hypothetical protein
MRLIDRFQAIKIFNEHNLLSVFGEKMDVVCSYHRAEPRSPFGCYTSVWSPKFNTDPKGAWFHHGQKSFSGRISESMPQAIEWATSKYGITEWVVSPFGRTAKIPASVLKKAMAHLEHV